MEQNNTLVSIITPSYNCAAYIGKTIESVQAQHYQNWEMLITDDGSTDNTQEVVSEYARKDGRIKLLVLPQRGGAGAARNNSIKEARGRYIAFCDADDSWLPEKLEKEIALMQQKEAALVYGAYYECTKDLKRIRKVMVPEVLTFKSEKHVNQVGTLTAMYDAGKIGKQYMTLLQKRQDWALWLQIMSTCKLAYGLQEPCAEYRLRPNSNSRNKMAMISFHAAVYEEVFHYPHWVALLYTLFVNIPAYLLKRIRVKRL